jgi:integrase
MKELTVVNKGVDRISESVSDRINNGINYGKKVIKNKINNDVVLQDEVIKIMSVRDVLDDIKVDYDFSGINISTELRDFLSIQKSDTTQTNYKKWINDFIYWCNNERINCLRITRREVESYLIYLCDGYSPNSVRSKIMGVCSFYQFLQYRYPRIIPINVFHKLKLPKIRLTRRVDVITGNDIKELKKELKRIGRNDIICVIDLIVKYGFRVGIFENMKIAREGNWKSISKECEMKGKFLKSEVDKIKKTGILKLKKYVITNTVLKYSRKLFREGKIGSPFSCHDIRHYFIAEKGKGLVMEDFIKFSRKIHKNVMTTINYMNIE